ncbi:MAG: SIS domain-containing protein [Anaerolineaceae bacterium]|nr:SIS domain-containing protein [Anaerolineaceae bacterium]
MLQTNGRSHTQTLHQLVADRFACSTAVPDTFFVTEANRIAEACWAMARRFQGNGRLLAFGNGAAASDAQHVAVEFVHPVIVGKRALPALALTNERGLLGGLPLDHHLAALARPQDIALGFSLTGREPDILAALHQAQEMGLLTLGLTAHDGGDLLKMPLDFCFVVENNDPLVVQETHETLYHILWELVHVFFEHEGLLN